jgi:beta-glucanase (GH16 family)
MTRPFIISLTALILIGCGGSSKNTTNNSSQTSTSSTASNAASSAAYNWNLVWSDEFDGDSLDINKWSYVQDCLVANELECYTNRPENVSVSDGKLHITARKETFTGPIWLDPSHTTTQDRTSGRITSLSGKWTYGRVEVKAKMPQGKGMGAAIWMFPASQDETHGPKYGDWPGSGEIDILEVFSPNTGDNSGDIHGTLVYGEALPGTRAATGKAYTPTTSNIWDNYHVYAFEWEAGETRWYFDNIHYATQTKDGWFTLYGPDGEKQFGAQSEPFDQDFYLILNVAITGVTDTVSFPQEMAVDYVRVYSCGLDPVTGKGCATNINNNIKPYT